LENSLFLRIFTLMKRNGLTLVALLFTSIFGLMHCKKSTGTGFEHAIMRPWFDKNCQSCHGSGGSNSRNWSYNPDDYESSIKKHASHIYEVVYTQKSMPPAGLTQNELEQFKAWYDAGYPVK
jgi:mono/diheme cytochrome c family protein